MKKTRSKKSRATVPLTWLIDLLNPGVDTTDSITEAMCKQSKAAFGDPDDFTDNGGLKVMNFLL